jgi:biopolymer transport protein ExbB
MLFEASQEASENLFDLIHCYVVSRKKCGAALQTHFTLITYNFNYAVKKSFFGFLGRHHLVFGSFFNQQSQINNRQYYMIEIFVKGGPVMYPLLACSVIALTVIIERLLFWIREDMRRNQPLVDEVLELCRQGEWETVREKVSRSKDYVIRILVTGILHREFSMVKAMESAGAEKVKEMRRYMSVLDTMITVAPLLGIFGTVIGIIASFDLLGASGIENPQAVTAGIAQALITTAAGLGIAILSVFPYNYFNSRVENAALAIEKYGTSLEIVFEKLTQRLAEPEGGAHEGKD